MPLATRTRTAAPTLAILSLALVFLCGVTVGALGMTMGLHRVIHRSIPWSESAKAPTLRKWKQELNLTDDQTRQIEMILDDFSKYYDNVVADGHTRILRVLNDDQKKKFEHGLKEHK